MNYFRANLANVSPGTNIGGVVDADYIPYTFSPRSLSALQTAVYNLLFPSSNRDVILKYTDSYTILLHSFGLDEVFTLHDPTITYQITDLNKFGNADVNLRSIYTSTLDTYSINNFMQVQPANRYTEMYYRSTPKLQRLAGLVSAYMVGLS